MKKYEYRVLQADRKSGYVIWKSEWVTNYDAQRKRRFCQLQTSTLSVIERRVKQ